MLNTVLTFHEASMLALESPAFMHEGTIPLPYTCDGSDLSPPLVWRNAPEETQSFVLIVDDPDAPDPAAPQRTWVHWVLFNLPPTLKGLPESVHTLPPGTREGLNDWNRKGYGGPCPPIGRHRYIHKLYALDTRLELPGTPTKAGVEHAMAGHILAQATLIGTYERHKQHAP